MNQTPRSVALARLEPALLQEFRADAVDHVEHVVFFSEPFDFWVWLGTATDSEREALSRQPDLEARVRRLAEEQGLAGLVAGVTVESQETVDREYAGRWFYRLR